MPIFKSVFIFLICFLCMSFMIYGQSIYAKKGILDLRNHKNWEDIIALDGEWEFYYQGFLNEMQFDSVKQKNYRYVPSASWSDERYNGKEISSNSFASYRLIILLPKDYPRNLAIRSYEQSSAYSMFINEKYLGGLGIISKCQKDGVAQTGSLLEDFELKDKEDTIQIIVHISNYHHRKAGLWHSLWLGKEKNILKQKDNESYLNIFLLGGLLMMAFYHLVLYALRSKDKSALYFSLSCTLVSLRLAVTGDIYLLHVFPSISWELKYKLEYLSLFVGLPSIMIFMRSVFPIEYKLSWVYFCLWASSFFIFMTLFFEVSIYSHLIPYFYILIVVTLLLGLYAILQALINKRKGAGIFLVGCTALVFVCINDILFSALIINTFYMIPWGFLIFFFSQATLLSVRFSGAFNQVESLSHELKNINVGLEQTIDERSKEVLKTNEELQKIVTELNANLDIVKNQKLEIIEKNQDLRDSLEYAKKIQEAILPDLKEVYRNLSDFFIYYQPRDVVSGDFYYFAYLPNIIIVAAVDCTGHGVPGAFMSLIGKELLDKIIHEKNIISPELILNELHIEVRKTLKQAETNNKDGMDIGIVAIHTEEKKIEFAGAKNPMYYNQNGKWGEFKGNPFSIGGFQKEIKREFDKHTLDIISPTTIYLFSDGYQDQFGGAEGKKYLTKNFRTLIQNIQSLSMSEQEKQLQQNMKNWWGVNNEPNDDILVMGIKL